MFFIWNGLKIRILKQALFWIFDSQTEERKQINEVNFAITRVEIIIILSGNVWRDFTVIYASSWCEDKFSGLLQLTA